MGLRQEGCKNPVLRLEGPFHVCGGLQPQKAAGLVELEERSKGTRAGWRWVAVPGWHRPWQRLSLTTLGSHQSSWGSHSGHMGEDCAVPAPMGLLQLSLLCASDDRCGVSPEVAGDLILPCVRFLGCGTEELPAGTRRGRARGAARVSRVGRAPWAPCPCPPAGHRAPGRWLCVCPAPPARSSGCWARVGGARLLATPELRGSSAAARCERSQRPCLPAAAARGSPNSRVPRNDG